MRLTLEINHLSFTPLIFRYPVSALKNPVRSSEAQSRPPADCLPHFHTLNLYPLVLMATKAALHYESLARFSFFHK